MGLEHLRHLRREGRVLEPERNRGVIEHGRVMQEGPLAEVVLHLWWVRWAAPEEVRGASAGPGQVEKQDRHGPGVPGAARPRPSAPRPYRQRVLSDPVIHLTFESGSGDIHGFSLPAALIHGVVPKVFEVELPSEGRVTGAALQPGALATAFGIDARELTGRVISAADLFGGAVKELRDALVAEPEESIRREMLAGYLTTAIRPEISEDPSFRLVRRACELVEEGDFTRVEDLAVALHVSPRTLQRAFPRLVGVPPLWVIRRRRLQRVAERLDRGDAPNLAELAAELGFADQAHLTREFRAVIGRPPSAYRGGRGS